MKRWLAIPSLLLCGWLAANEPRTDIPEAIAEEEVVPADPYEVIPEAFRKAYFGAKPDGYLVDPQRLLNSVVANERTAFLRYHASDSKIDLYVCLLGGNQRLPDGLAAEWVERFFNGGKPAVLVFFPMGDPARSEMFLSPGVAARLSEVEQRQALGSAITQALAKSDPYSQFEAFVVQMSIRTYWMEKSLGLVDADAGGERKEKPVVLEAAEPGILEQLDPYLEMARPWLWKAGAAAVGSVVFIMLVWWSRVRARYRFPDFSVESRLGGGHGAGVGGVISFASASVSPALQRDGVPGEARRR